MPKRILNLREGRPELDIVSYGRGGRSDRLSIAEVQQIARTVRRDPEVMLKVLPNACNNLKSVRAHLDYINRKGEVALETDDGERLQGKDVSKALLEDWDLDLEEHRRQSDLAATDKRQPPRLVHKLMFSMPAGTPSEKVLEAVQNFAREEFGLKHRYAMALHTDEPHPHVHMVVKAVSEQGERLNIKKATLREWRQEFARHLRAVGVAANATARHVRGEITPRKPDGIYRAALRGESTHMREHAEAVAVELLKGGNTTEAAKAELLATRRLVEKGWRSVGRILADKGQRRLSENIAQFIAQMSPPMTEREWMTRKLHMHYPKTQNKKLQPVR